MASIQPPPTPSWRQLTVDHLQMTPELEAECVQEAQARAVALPSDWSVRELVDKLREAMLDVSPAVLKMAAGLRNQGANA